MLRRLLPALCACVLLLGAAEGVKATPAGPDLARAYNGFGLRLFAQLRGQDDRQNLFMSPASVALALAIVANGGAGTTRESILDVLGAKNAPIAGFNASNQALMSALTQTGGDLQFTIANALWINDREKLLPSFVSTSRDVFKAEAQALPFGDPSAAKTINDWVDTHTNGRIPEIVDQTNSQDLVVVTNAIAMKAKWLVEFEKAATHDAPFETASGAPMTVSMMSRDGTFGYADAQGWQVARLPYRGDRFAMYVLLPHKGVALHDALKSFDDAAFDRAIGELKPQEIAFSMPRFTATYKAELNAALIQLGMGDAFEASTANFSNLVPPPQAAWINLVVHRAFVRVDEEGTEAAAATAVAIRTLAIRMPPEIKMIVDRPFLMAIRDDKTKQLLFVGAIYKPEK